MRQRGLHQGTRHIAESTGLLGVLRLDREGIRDKPVQVSAIHRFNDFFFSVFTLIRLRALSLLDLSNPMLEQPPQFIRHFQAVLRA